MFLEIEREEFVDDYGTRLPKIDIIDTESLDWDKNIHIEILKVSRSSVTRIGLEFLKGIGNENGNH